MKRTRKVKARDSGLRDSARSQSEVIDLKISLGIHGLMLTYMSFSFAIAMPTAESAVIVEINDNEAASGNAKDHMCECEEHYVLQPTTVGEGEKLLIETVNS